MSQADKEERFLPPEEEAEVLALLEAALRPSELDPELNERLLEMALEDPLAPPSAEELVESERLRDALAGQGTHEDLAVLRALGAPFAQDDASGVAERVLQQTLDKSPKKPRSNVVYAMFGAGSAILAAAAAVALLVQSPRRAEQAPAAAMVAAAPTAAPTYIAPHSTADMFDERFDTASTTARMDLIASARSRDLRDNRYASWGVK